MNRWTEIAKHISAATGNSFTVENSRSVGGGCINQGYMISDGSISYFVKLNSASLTEMFIAEAKGLKQIADTQTIKVPKPIAWGTTDNKSYLVMEHLDLGRGKSNWQEMGKQLAKLHHYPITNNEVKFGWDLNNTIGSTPQINDWMNDWGQFFAKNRIGYQLQLAKRRGGHFPNGEALIAAIPEILGNHQPQPSLVHGDLWGGNADFTSNGEPTIFDPATYIGDREVDLAMTELFGGFPREFYQGYEAEFPLNPGYEHRKILYNLYHILNHFNLFGGGYANQANSAIAKLITV
jgi:fructosamine-3-kinase